MAESSEPGKPSSTIRIEKTIRNAPVDDADIEIMNEGRKPAKGKKPAAEEAEETSEDEFAGNLQDHTVKIHVDRVSPREYKGKAIAGMIEEYVPPITIEEIETDIRNRFGGGRFRIRALKNGRFVGARGINVYGDPKLPVPDETDSDFGEDFNPAAFNRDPFPGGPPVMDDEIGLLRKEIEKERLKKVLNDVKSDGNPQGQRSPHEDPATIRREAEDRVRKEMEMRREIDGIKTDFESKMNGFMGNMERMLRSQKETDPARDTDIVQLDNKIERIKTEVLGELKGTFSEFRQMIQTMQQKPVERPDNTPQLFHALIEGFSKMSGSSETKLQAIASAESAKTQAMMETMRAINDANAKVAQAQTDKLVTVLQSQGGGGGIGEMSKTIGAVRDMAETLGWAPGGGGGDMEGAQPPDMMGRVMGLVEKALPSLLAANAAKSRQTGGQQLSQQEIQQIIAQQAQAAAQQIAVPMAQRLAAQQFAEMQKAEAARRAAPPPQPPIQPPPPMPVQPPVQQQPRNVSTPISTPTPPPPVQQQVDEAPAEPVQEQIPVVIPIPEVAQAQQTTEEREVADDKSSLVNACMEVLMKEVKIRPRKPEWNEMAFEELPEEVVDKLVMVTDSDGLLTVIQPYAKPEYVEALKNMFAADQRAVDWFVKGLNEIKQWYADEEQPQAVQA